MLCAVVKHDHAARLRAPLEPCLGRGHFPRVPHVQGIISAQHVPHDEVRMRPDAPRLGRSHFAVRRAKQRLQSINGLQRGLHVRCGWGAPTPLVTHGVPTNCVARRLCRFKDVRMPCRLLAHHKKGRLGAVLGQDVQHPRGDRRVWAVVERQMHRFRPLNRPCRAWPNGPAEPLQQRRNTASDIQ